MKLRRPLVLPIQAATDTCAKMIFCVKARRGQEEKTEKILPTSYSLHSDKHVVLHPTRPNFALMANVTRTLFWLVEQRWNRSREKTCQMVSGFSQH